jgi:glycosyltransferase involved in cell wall biosynthesis
MDIYPNIAIQMGLISDSSPLAWLLRRMSLFTMRHANGLIVIGRCMQRRVIEMGIKPERIAFIPNWSNCNVVQSLPHDTNPFRYQQNWDDKFVVVFAGNIGIPQYFDDILEVCRRFHGQSDFVFALIGNGLRRQEIEAYKREHNLENIVLLPFQPHSEQSYFLSAGDLHLVSLREGIEGLAVPSKTYSILAAGRPIIYQGCESGEIARLIEEENIGQFVPLHDPDTLEKAILEYRRNPDLANRQGTNARRLTENRLNYQVICRQYALTLGTISAA